MTRLTSLSLFFALSLTACGGGSGTDGGTDAGQLPTDGGLLLDFTPPSGAPVANGLLLTVTGEAFATEGLGFPATSGGEAYFLDGWEVTFDHVIVVLDALTVSENPDLSPNDPSQTGPAVARASGPWAVDLAKPGPLAAKELNGRAWPLARLADQNLVAGAPKFATSTKYAFGYELVAARVGTWNVNLDATGVAAFRDMEANGWTMWLSGTATWKGDQAAPACRSTDATYDFGRYPKAVQFAFGFKAPVAFTNCENPELSPVGSRGIQTQAGSETVVQATFHLDHPFWEALEEDAPLRFDALAARKAVAMGAGPASAYLTEADLVGLDFQGFRDPQGAAIPWRTCGPALPNERTQGVVAYDPVNVPVNPSGGAAGLKDVVDYMTYNLSTSGHLNNDGLCFPARKYPSPP